MTGSAMLTGWLIVAMAFVGGWLVGSGVGCL